MKKLNGCWCSWSLTELPIHAVHQFWGGFTSPSECIEISYQEALHSPTLCLAFSPSSYASLYHCFQVFFHLLFSLSLLISFFIPFPLDWFRSVTLSLVLSRYTLYEAASLHFDRVSLLSYLHSLAPSFFSHFFFIVYITTSWNIFLAHLTLRFTLVIVSFLQSLFFSFHFIRFT